MLKNFLIIAYRNLLKNSGFTFINISGLAAGIAAFLFIINYVTFERSYESFHHNANNIFRVTLDLYNGSEYVVTDCETYQNVGPMLKDQMPEVLDYVRMFHNDGLQDITAGEKKFLDEGIYFADPSAFTVFTLDVVHGVADEALTAPYQAVITTSSAKKFFGHTDVTGQTLKIDNREYNVSAVIQDLPFNTHLKFTILLSHATLFEIYPWYKNNVWGGNNEYTYLLMAPGTDLASFNGKLKDFSIALKDKIGEEMLQAERIKDIHLYSTKSFEPEPPGSARLVYSMLIIAIFIISLAWVNYVNLSTARAVDRGREVGIRKVMGSIRSQLVYQFLCESFIINVTAAVLAFVFYQTALPLLQNLTGTPLSADFSSDRRFWYLFLCLTVVGSVLSGLYPAFVLSSFQPVAVLKGRFRSSSHGQRLRKVLVTFQFGATVTLMVGLVTVYLQISHLRNHDLGMKIDQTLVLRAPTLDVSDSVRQSMFSAFEHKLLQNSNIERVARSESVPGISIHELSTNSGVRRVGQQENGSYNYYCIDIDADFIPALDMKMLAGRNFEEGAPNHDQVIINEEAVSRLGFANAADALGAQITYWTRQGGEPSTIIGVIGNYYQRSPKEAHIPMIFPYTESGRYFSVSVKSGDIERTLASVRQTWDAVFANSVFHYFFLDDTYEQQYHSDRQFGKVMATFAGLAVLIACLGLFGLSSFTIVQRTKEIGIRKVLGASVVGIVRLLSGDFARIVIIASLLALPVSYYAMEQWLSNYANRIDLSVWIFALPVILILAIALLTVSFQTIRTAVANPVNSLRQE